MRNRHYWINSLGHHAGDIRVKRGRGGPGNNKHGTDHPKPEVASMQTLQQEGNGPIDLWALGQWKCPQIWKQHPQLLWNQYAYYFWKPLHGLWGSSGLQMTSVVTSEVRFELSGLNYPCSHASLPCKCFSEMIETTDNSQLWSIDLRSFASK